jgi:hypothetical protein
VSEVDVRMLRWLVAIVVLVVAAAGCDARSSETTTMVVSETTTTAAATTTTTLSATTSTALSTTTSTMALPPVAVTEQLDPTTLAGDGPVWTRSGYEFDRRRSYWLGVQRDEFVLLSWRWPRFVLTVQRSPDGLSWSDPVESTGLPSPGQPEHWLPEPGSAISASSAGLIGLFDTTPNRNDSQSGNRVYTSIDGTTWVQEPLPAIAGGSSLGGPYGVATGPLGFAVLATADEHRPGSDRLFVRPIEGAWQTIDLPAGGGNPWSSWVVAAHDDFLVRGVNAEEASTGPEYLYRVDVSGMVTIETTPTDYPPIEWNEDLLVWDQYALDPHPSLYVGPDGSTWYRLPIPEFVPEDPERPWRSRSQLVAQAWISSTSPSSTTWSLPTCWPS